jgi:hypothetical protein|tara:strand:+ start:435 stop:710 length:276 start_codon:yes stop_codon:yes gene_type:complete
MKQMFMTHSLQNNNHFIVNRIIRVLSSIGQVEYRIGTQMVEFYKNNVLFGKIENGIVYLLNALGQLKQLDVKLSLKENVFIQQAKIAYNAV